MFGQNIFDDLMGFPFQGELILRILLSCLAGAIIGYERKKREKAAGMRTHIIAAMASAIFSICSKYSYFDILEYQGLSVDASRISANIVTGICFLGAGAVFVKSRSVVGLTTAAGIWAVSGVGMCFGNGMYIVGFATMLIMVILQYSLHNRFDQLEGFQPKECTVLLEEGDKHMDELLGELRKTDPMLKVIHISRESENRILLKIYIHPTDMEMYTDIWSFMKRYSYVISCDV
ncbi:MAG: MgtC/SapB family protein [Lachnospiraceae bacterium]|nr:MgtC/SapB family protein [Lachnospiraceae bacterium]